MAYAAGVIFCGLLKRPLQTVSLSVAVGERRQAKTGFNQFQDRGGVVGRVVYIAFFGKR